MFSQASVGSFTVYRWADTGDLVHERSVGLKKTVIDSGRSAMNDERIKELAVYDLANNGVRVAYFVRESGKVVSK